jgi:ureidoglycolate lyase
MSMFSCFPRNLSGIGIEQNSDSPDPESSLLFKIAILERHPYTTQTFSPLGLSASDPSAFYIVVVARSLSSSAAAEAAAPTLSDTGTGIGTSTQIQIENPPDLTSLRAFICRGDQAVTYGAGTWHAPMVVLGSRRVDFVVTQFVNGVADDDCQEVMLGENARAVDLSGLGLRVVQQKAKL